MYPDEALSEEHILMFGIYLSQLRDTKKAAVFFLLRRFSYEFHKKNRIGVNASKSDKNHNILFKRVSDGSQEFWKVHLVFMRFVKRVFYDLLHSGRFKMNQ